MRMKRLGLCVLLLLLGWISALAQVSTTAEVSGAVVDEAGAAIEGARVTLQNLQTSATFTDQTDDQGRYIIRLLPPGQYELVIEKPGFAKFVQTGLNLRIGQKATINVKLKVAPIEQEIEVRAEPPLVEPAKTEVSQVIEGIRITDLPINGRQFVDFALLTPGVTIGRALSSGSSSPLPENVIRISIAGLSEQYSNFFALDGADHTISLSGFQHSMPSQEAVQEFRVIHNTYSAEYGRALAGVVNVVTKSGGNEFHGVVYEFFRNDDLDATNSLSPPQFNVLRQNQFGFSVGGPIVKNRTFFFTNYEGQRKAESPFYTRFLLENLEAINQTKRFYQLSEEKLDLLRVEDNDRFLARVDHQFNPENNVIVRYHFVDERNDDAPGAPAGQGAPSSFVNNPVRDQSLLIKNTSILNARTTNESLFQYSRRTFHFDSISGEPHIIITNILNLGRHIGPASFYREERWQVADTFNYLRHNHALRFGVDVNHIRDHLVFPVTIPGFLVFSPESFFGLPPFSQPTPFLFQVGIPRSRLGQEITRSTDFKNTLFPDPEFEEISTIRYNHNTFDVFFQDEWRGMGSLTLSYGIRYFVETRGGFDLDSDLNNVQPRIGLAYGFGNGRGVVRAGAGIFVGPLPFANSPVPDRTVVGGDINDLRQLMGPAFAQAFSENVPLGVSVGPLPLPPLTAAAAFNYLTRGIYPRGPLIPFVLNHAAKDSPNPYAGQWSLQVEYTLAQDIAIRLGYQGVRALKMTTYRQVNVTPTGQLPTGETRYGPLNGRFGVYQVEIPGNTSIYHGATFSLDKRFGRGFLVNVEYTFSRTIDRVNSGSTISLRDGPEDPMDLDANRALSNQHIAHRFVTSFLARAPKRSFLRNFSVGLVVSVESPRYFTIFTGFDANGDLETGTDRVGAIGRNTFKGDSFSSVDLRVSRSIRFSDRVSAELIAEAFNLFNTFNVTDVNTVYGAPEFIGPVPKEFGQPVVAPLASFGTPSNAADARKIQFAVKFHF